MTNKQIANFIAKRYLSVEEYKLFKINHNLKIEKDATKIISLIKEEFTISKHDMDNYFDEIKRKEPMPKTQLFVSLVDELAKQGRAGVGVENKRGAF